MAETVTVEGQQYTRRSPWGAWGLAFVTLGIYGLVWHYKVNDEARRYLRDESIRPGLAVLALVPGGLIIVPALVTHYRTGQRVARMEEKAGILRTVEPVLALVASLFYLLHMPYLQGHLNALWDATVAGAALTGSDPAAIPPPPPLA